MIKKLLKRSRKAQALKRYMRRMKFRIKENLIQGQKLNNIKNELSIFKKFRKARSQRRGPNAKQRRWPNALKKIMNRLYNAKIDKRKKRKAKWEATKVELGNGWNKYLADLKESKKIKDKVRLFRVNGDPKYRLYLKRRWRRRFFQKRKDARIKAWRKKNKKTNDQWLARYKASTKPTILQSQPQSRGL